LNFLITFFAIFNSSKKNLSLFCEILFKKMSGSFLKFPILWIFSLESFQNLFFFNTSAQSSKRRVFWKFCQNFFRMFSNIWKYCRPIFQNFHISGEFVYSLKFLFFKKKFSTFFEISYFINFFSVHFSKSLVFWKISLYNFKNFQFIETFDLIFQNFQFCEKSMSAF